MKSKTYNEGANDERSVWLAKLRRALKSFPATSGALEIRVFLEELIDWGKQRAARTKKPGGIGRK